MQLAWKLYAQMCPALFRFRVNAALRPFERLLRRAYSGVSACLFTVTIGYASFVAFACWTGLCRYRFESKDGQDVQLSLRPTQLLEPIYRYTTRETIESTTESTLDLRWHF